MKLGRASSCRHGRPPQAGAGLQALRSHTRPVQPHDASVLAPFEASIACCMVGTARAWGMRVHSRRAALTNSGSLDTSHLPRCLLLLCAH